MTARVFCFGVLWNLQTGKWLCMCKWVRNTMFWISFAIYVSVLITLQLHSCPRVVLDVTVAVAFQLEHFLLQGEEACNSNPWKTWLTLSSRRVTAVSLQVATCQEHPKASLHNCRKIESECQSALWLVLQVLHYAHLLKLSSAFIEAESAESEYSKRKEATFPFDRSYCVYIVFRFCLVN